MQQRFAFFSEDSVEWGNKELESSLLWQAFLIKVIISLNALFTEHFVVLEFSAESLAGVIFPFLRKQRLPELKGPLGAGPLLWLFLLPFC